LEFRLIHHTLHTGCTSQLVASLKGANAKNELAGRRILIVINHVVSQNDIEHEKCNSHFLFHSIASF